MNPVCLQLFLGILAFVSLVMAARSGLPKAERAGASEVRVHRASREQGADLTKRLSNRANAASHQAVG
jgi:hypothetical protein